MEKYKNHEFSFTGTITSKSLYNKRLILIHAVRPPCLTVKVMLLHVPIKNTVYKALNQLWNYGILDELLLVLVSHTLSNIMHKMRLVATLYDGMFNFQNSYLHIILIILDPKCSWWSTPEMKLNSQEFCLKTFVHEYYSAIKKNNIMAFADKRIELGNIMLSEISQLQKTKGWVFSLISRW